MHRDLCTAGASDICGLRLHTLFRPAEHVGGDAFDVRRLSTDSVAVVLLDATGHGVAAAMLAAYAQHAFRRALRDAAERCDADPSAILASVNRDLIEADLPDCQSVAAAVVIYDERLGLLRVSRAGLPHPLMVSADGARPVACDGPLLGAVAGATFSQERLTLEPGASVVLHSDGLNELLAEADDLATLDVATSEWTGSLAQADVTSAFESLERRAEARSDRDDLTVIVLQPAAHASSLAATA